jgi:hypothetical protein
MTCFALAVCLTGVAPSLAFAEVDLRGHSRPGVELPLLHGNAALFSFEDVFGISGVLVNDLPQITISSTGRPQVGIWFEYDDLVDVLEASSSKAGKSLDVATSEFEAALRDIACAGAYDAFLDSGGSLRLWLTALRKKKQVDPLRWRTERFTVIDFEVDSLQDCEAD